MRTRARNIFIVNLPGILLHAITQAPVPTARDESESDGIESIPSSTSEEITVNGNMLINQVRMKCMSVER